MNLDEFYQQLAVIRRLIAQLHQPVESVSEARTFSIAQRSHLFAAAVTASQEAWKQLYTAQGEVLTEALKQLSEVWQQLHATSKQFQEQEAALQAARAQAQTEQLRYQNTLRLLETTMQHLQEATLITTADLNQPGPTIIFVNSAFTRMTGYTPDEVIGKTPRILQGEKTDRALLKQLRQNLEQGQPFAAEIINYHKSGTEYRVQLFCTPIHNAQGEVTHFVSVQNHLG